MKKFCFLAVAMLLTISTFAETIPATDARITFVGRSVVEEGSYRFDFPSTYFRVAFTGKTLAMRVTDTKSNYYAVWLDAPTSDTPTHVIQVQGTDTIIELITKEDTKGSKVKEHQVIIQRRTEANCGTTTVKEFITDGKFLQAAPLKARQIEFIGDSYTCGYGVDALSRRDKFKDETENASRTYASIVARYFDADYFTICHSGRGITRNAGSGVPWEVMTDIYQYTLDRDSLSRWNAAECPFRPAMTVIYLGANDFSSYMAPAYSKFAKDYFRLLGYIKANYGEEHPILCVSTKAHDYLFTYVKQIVHTCGLKNVEYLGYFPGQHLDTDEDLGAGWHPNYNGQKKLAFSIIPYIATMTGWGLQDVPVK